MALAKFQGEMPSVPKSKTARVPMKAGGSYSYKYADLADVTAAAMPILSKNGLAFICQSEESTSRGFLLVGMLVHESGESVTGSLPLYGGTNQELGASLTYARRYLLGSLTGIVTDDDTDGEAAVGAERTTKAPARQRQLAKKPAESSPPPEEQAPPAAPVVADVAWADKIKESATFDELNSVYNEADAAGVFGQMIGDETVKSRLFERRNELNSKDAQ
jgi:hypothetical protein